jgi:hypothetical protein
MYGDLVHKVPVVLAGHRSRGRSSAHRAGSGDPSKSGRRGPRRSRKPQGRALARHSCARRGVLRARAASVRRAVTPVSPDTGKVVSLAAVAARRHSRWPRRPTRSGWPPPRRPPRRRPPSSPPRCAAHPAIALSAYRNAEAIMARAQPGCGISWNLLAASAGSNRATPTTAPPTRAAPRSAPSTARLDGTLPGNEVIVSASQLGRVTYARARLDHAVPAGDMVAVRLRRRRGRQGRSAERLRRHPAARYLCSGGAESARPVAGADGDPALQQLDGLRPQRARMGRLYATGVAPVNLPPITGPTPPSRTRGWTPTWSPTQGWARACRQPIRCRCSA